MSEEHLAKKEDIRIRRTYKLLMDSLISLLKEKPFKEINVTDICDRAMVHRTTFYKHFEDKYHLLKFSINEIQKNIEEKCISYNSFDNPKQYYMDMLKSALACLSANKKMCLLIISKNAYDSIIIMFHKIVAENMKSKLEDYEKRGVHYPIPIPVVAEFYTGALIALAIWWLENNTSILEEEMVNYIDIMTEPFQIAKGSVNSFVLSSFFQK